MIPNVPNEIQSGDPILASWLNDLRNAIVAQTPLPSPDLTYNHTPHGYTTTVRPQINEDNFDTVIMHPFYPELIPREGASGYDFILSDSYLHEQKSGTQHPFSPLSGDSLTGAANIGESWWANFTTDELGIVSAVDFMMSETDKETVEFEEPTGYSGGTNGDYWLKAFTFVSGDSGDVPEVEQFLHEDILWYVRPWSNVGGGEEVFKQYNDDIYELRTFVDHYPPSAEYHEPPSGYDDGFQMVEFEGELVFETVGDTIKAIPKVKIPLPNGETDYYSWTNMLGTNTFGTNKGVITDGGFTHDSCACDTTTVSGGI